MKEIKLTKGKVALVDDEDFEYLNQFKWYAHKSHNTNYYAIGSGKCINGKRKSIYMQKIIMQTPDHLQCDHIDHNGLNNQKKNLRNATQSQNQMNCPYKSKTNFRGVSYDKRWNGRFYAYISINKKFVHLGTFKDAVSAAIARDTAAKIHYGEFAILNFK